jgi:dye decolorizing peroxidase
LPPFGVDRLEPRWGGTDLLLQICADDPMTVAHTARVLLKNVRSLVTQRWRQTGFRPARGADPAGVTMRNLMGQVDGTVNPVTGTVDFAEVVWDDGRQQPWLAGGTLMVLRRIRMNLDTWDELDRASKELAVGRRLDTGAPLTGQHENDPGEIAALANGIPVIPPNAHIALAHPHEPGERFLRRPYNFDDPPPAGQTSESGLIFATFQRDIDRQFLPVQRRLAESDAMNRWITPIGSAVYVIPPGVQPGQYLGTQLLGSSRN